MQLVTDRAMDLTPEQLAGLQIHQVPLILTLDGKSYRSGEDIEPEEFYRLLDQSEGYPTTSQPSAGDFAEIYRRLAASDPDILSVHISSGLSGTVNSARLGAAMVPEANITIVDTLTLSCPEGWQVEAAARAIKASWSLDQILRLLDQVRAVTDAMFTVATLKYLIHGGRISHIKGLLASLLNIKPIIGVEKVRGTYVPHGQERTLKRAIEKMAQIAVNRCSPKQTMRVQVLHGNNPEGAELLRQSLAQMVDCIFLPISTIAPVLGAHTGTGLVGLAFAPASEYPEVPE